MKIAIVGGGPAGLFLAKLLRVRTPELDIEVFEQNGADSTYGFGIGLLGRSLNFLKKVDEQLYCDILKNSAATMDMEIVHSGKPVRVRLEESVAIERIRLLQILQSHCKALDVKINFESRMEDICELKQSYDLLVGADGVNSLVRKTFIENFKTKFTPQRNKFAWYATSKVFDAASLIFEQTEYGMMIIHAYPYREDRSGFVIECAPEVWEKAGFGELDNQQTREKCEAIFAPYLDGHGLLSQNLTWFTPSIVRTPNWHHENVVLIGDALRTVHPSIGSGTRVAMRDADVLSEAISKHKEHLQEAMQDYKRLRLASSDLFQKAATQSIAWYESIDKKLHLDPVTFAFSYMTRTGVIDYQRLRETDPKFVKNYECEPVSILEGEY